MTDVKPLSRIEMARRAARDIQDGWVCNLGIGIPTLVADHLPQDREIILHSENGLLGMGPAPAPEEADPWIINAGKQQVTLLPGASVFHHADSFSMIRGGHIDLCILGAFEVAANGDLANWATSTTDNAPAVGGAMDLAVGAKNIWVMTEHTTRDGKPKLVRNCSYPLTASGVVRRIYTNLAVIDVTTNGFEVVEIISGLTLEALQERTGAPLHVKETPDV